MQNDKLELLKSGSLQHLGENMLAFLLQIASSPDLSGVQRTKDEGISASSSAIYYDILVCYTFCLKLSVSIL